MLRISSASCRAASIGPASSLQSQKLSLRRQSFLFFWFPAFSWIRATREQNSPQDYSGATPPAQYFEQALLDNGLDVAVLENEPSTFPCLPHRDIHHGSEVVGSNYLVGGQHPKRMSDCAPQAIVEIRFPPR